MSSHTGENGGVLRYQVQENERRLRTLEEWRQGTVDPGRISSAEQRREIRDDVSELKAIMERVKVTVETIEKRHAQRQAQLLLAIAAATLTFALSVLAATGRI